METVIGVLHGGIFRTVGTGAKDGNCCVEELSNAERLQGCKGAGHTSCCCVATGHRWDSSSKELIMQEEEGGTMSTLPHTRLCRWHNSLKGPLGCYLTLLMGCDCLKTSEARGSWSAVPTLNSGVVLTLWANMMDGCLLFLDSESGE